MGDEVVVSVARVEEAPTPEIGEMLAEYGSVPLAAARLITLNDAEAEDVVQVTFEIALRRASPGAASRRCVANTSTRELIPPRRWVRPPDMETTGAVRRHDEQVVPTPVGARGRHLA